MSDLYLTLVLVLQIGALCAIVGTLYCLFFNKTLQSPKNLEASLTKLLKNVVVVTQIGLSIVIFAELACAVMRFSVALDFGSEEIYFFRLGLVGIVIIFGLLLSMTRLPKSIGYGILFLTWALYFMLLTWASIFSLVSIWYVVGGYAFLCVFIALLRYAQYLQINKKR